MTAFTPFVLLEIFKKRVLVVQKVFKYLEEALGTPLALLIIADMDEPSVIQMACKWGMKGTMPVELLKTVLVPGAWSAYPRFRPLVPTDFLEAQGIRSLQQLLPHVLVRRAEDGETEREEWLITETYQKNPELFLELSEVLQQTFASWAQRKTGDLKSPRFLYEENIDVWKPMLRGGANCFVRQNNISFYKRDLEHFTYLVENNLIFPFRGKITVLSPEQKQLRKTILENLWKDPRNGLFQEQAIFALPGPVPPIIVPYGSKTSPITEYLAESLHKPRLLESYELMWEKKDDYSKIYGLPTGSSWPYTS